GRADEAGSGQIVGLRGAGGRRVVEAGATGIILIMGVEIAEAAADAPIIAEADVGVDLDPLRDRRGGVAGDESGTVIFRHLQVGEAGAEQRDVELALSIEETEFPAELP